MKNKKFSRFICGICFADHFKTQRGLHCHKTVKHLYQQPPPHLPPKVTTETERGASYMMTLLGGSTLQLGDRVQLYSLAVVTKIVRTEGSNDVKVDLRIITHSYTKL